MQTTGAHALLLYIAHENEHDMGYCGIQLPHMCTSLCLVVYAASAFTSHDAGCAGCSGAFINEVRLLAVSPIAPLYHQG